MSLNFGQNLFPTRNEIIQSYSYYDIESGTGVVTFYGVRDIGSGSMLLIEKPIQLLTDVVSQETYHGSFSSVTDWNHDGALTFDTEEFKVSKVVKGVAYATFPISGNTNDGVTIADLKIVHVYDGGTTNLTSEIDIAEFDDGGGGWQGSYLVKLGEISQTIMKKGDKLRLSMTLTCDNGAYLHHNPGRSGYALTVNIPFKIPL